RRALEARLHGAGERRRDLEDEARHLEVELARTSEAERQAALEADRREEILRGVEDEERSLSGQEGLPPQGAAAVVRGDVHALEAAMERDMREAESLHRRREVVRAVMSEQAAELTSIRHDLQVLDALAGQAQDAYEHARRQREEAQGAWEGAQREAGEARLLVIESRARVEALERAPRDLEGHRLAAQAPGVRGEAVTRLDVPSELGRAVDACLGGWSEALEARDGRTLKDVLTSLGDSGLGGVALVMTQVGDAAAPARAVAAGEGLEALIDRLGASADQHLAGKLLGDVVLVDRWSSGWRIVQQHPGLRAVTREGDLITSWGVSLARSGPAGGAARRGARSALEGARLSLARAESRMTTAHRNFSWSRSHERAALECLESLEARVAAAAEGLDRLERNRASWEAEMERLAERDRAIADEMAERRVRLAALHDELAALEGEAALRELAWEMAARRRAELVSRREEARQRREEAAGALAAVLERRRLLEVRLSDLRGDLQRLDTRLVEPSALRRLAGVERHAERGWELVVNHLVTLQERQPQLRRASREAAAQLSRARERLEELRRLLDEARRRHSGAEVEASGLRVREEAEAEGLRRDLDADEDQALAAPCPELPEGTDPAERLRWLEAELRRMGPVNPLAASEYRELSERVEFLESQLHDLEASRGELRKVIKRLDDQMRALFTSAYEEVASHFEESFRLLFPGGRGRLRLVGPDDLTATGVEIEAQPLGKKLSRLGLLSGGERALVALAFLFAVFQARPSPFYILDEVDAALDDANLRRFLRLVGQLRQSAQLVIVTHQQQTMEAADVLYGVTIEPGGSSQVVSQRMAQVAVPA
ncbi:MAG: AAA family ATPase, partial [Actinomycetota bacterium]|nr:AAA family ATPase [Actinomycetota bacterium]